MNAALFLELVDAVSRSSGPAELAIIAERVTATAFHPLERRVLERAVRARAEAFALHRAISTELLADAATPPMSLAAR